MNPTAVSAALADLANMLDSATSLLEVNSLQHRCEALRRVLQVAKVDAVWQNRFRAQRLRSMLRMGEMLTEADLHKGGRPSTEEPLTEGQGFKLADFGISYKLSAECQQIWRMPRARFDAYIARGEQSDDDGNIIEISKAGLLVEAAKSDLEAEWGINPTEKQSPTIIPLDRALGSVKSQAVNAATTPKTPDQVTAGIAAVKEGTVDKARRAEAGFDPKKSNQKNPHPHRYRPRKKRRNARKPRPHSGQLAPRTVSSRSARPLTPIQNGSSRSMTPAPTATALLASSPASRVPETTWIIS